MRNKIFTLFLALMAFTGTISAAIIEEVKIGDLYYNLDATNKTAEVTCLLYKYNFDYYSYLDLTNANIPSSVTYNSTKYSVTSIGVGAFYNCTSLTNITIPSSVTSIGDKAFYRCDGLTSVAIPNSVTSIGASAFSGCSGLKSVTIGNGVTSIGEEAFENCTSLTSVVWNAKNCADLNSPPFPQSVTSFKFGNAVEHIPAYLCSDMTNLTSVTIPNSVTSIGYDAFYDCAGLTTVTIGNSVTSIGGEAFRGCTALTSVTIPNSVTGIGSWAFADCTALKSVTIGNGITSIGDYAFAGCNLTSVYIFDIAAWCRIKFGYYYANPLSAGHLYLDGKIVTDLVIPNSVTSIGDKAFYRCDGLTSVAIPNSVTSIGASAFSGCSGLKSVTIGNGVTSIGEEAFYECSGLTSVTIPNSVTSIGSSAFGLCTGLNSVTIGNGVKSIGEEAFAGCYDLTSMVVESKNAKYDSRNNCNAIIETATNTLVVGCKASTIPNSVTSIGESAFENCSGLKSITIPSSITSIQEKAFYWTALEQIVFMPANTWIEVQISAFGECTLVKTVTCYSKTPPILKSEKDAAAFDSRYKKYLPNVTLYVPQSAMATYKEKAVFGAMNIQPIGSESAETTDLKTIPGDNSVEIVWPSVAGAASYELIVKDSKGNVICTLVFGPDGLLTSLNFAAPAREGSDNSLQASGFAFTVNGLEAGTTYNLTMTAKDSKGKTLSQKTLTFSTKASVGLQTPSVMNGDSQKLLRNGQIFILRGDRTYTLTGQEVK